MTEKILQALIEEKREQLIKVVKKYGLRSSIAVHYSKELDKLLNEYQREIAVDKQK